MGYGLAARLVAAAYRDEHEAAEKASRLGANVDVCLFASPVPYEYARRAGAINGPATFVPLNGAALRTALLHASLAGNFDLTRISLDVLARSDIDEMYAELGLSAEHVHAREEVASATMLAAFHDRLWRRGETTVALTCVHAVAQRLAASGVPAITVRSTGSAIRSALRTAALLGAHHRLEEAALAIVVVDVQTLRETVRRTAPRYWRDELRLSVHRLLLQDAQRIGAAVMPVGEHCFLVTATRGSLAAVTEGFRVPPFVERAQAELGVELEVGVGMGRSAQEAETHARAALTRAQSGRGQHGFALDREGRALVPPPRPSTVLPAAGQPRGIETLARLADKLPAQESSLTVDAEAAGKLLGVTPRTARRLLRVLVEEGLAWPLPPNRSPQPGRPRQLYRLIVEKLDQRPQRRG
ncbi:MAG TPA: GTP cyclohydrolase IIa [Streptosporangiaceae bacterium]|nr:GTP cyclohydrolase IIa [Streptosporangiaceae bacterium]